MLDACVLVPITLADTLLRIAEHELYRPLWSGRVLDEAANAIATMHPDIDVDRLSSRFADMEDAFPDARVTNWVDVVDGIILPDPDDRHVAAAAIVGRADTIVTFNVGDFPEEVLEPFGVMAVRPDAFLLDQLDLAPRVVLEALREQAAHARDPRLTPTDLLARLSRTGVPEFADAAGRMI